MVCQPQDVSLQDLAPILQFDVPSKRPVLNDFGSRGLRTEFFDDGHVNPEQVIEQGPLIIAERSFGRELSHL